MDITEYLRHIGGGKLFSLPKVEVPDYRVGVFGDWEVVVKDRPVIRGYFHGVQPMAYKNYVLRNRKTQTVWMSLTPLELESHAFHIQLAHGHVVVGGLGMGMYLYNLCKKSDVERIDVIEKDVEVIRAFYQFSGCESWPGWDKVRIIESDILKMVPRTVEQCVGCDYLYVDIWPLIGDKRAMDDMKVICEVVRPKKAGWWCQEVDYFELSTKGKVGDCPKEASEVLLEGWNIPAAGHLIPDYRNLVRAAAFNITMM